MLASTFVESMQPLQFTFVAVPPEGRFVSPEPLPTNAVAVTVPALKFPDPSRSTMVLAVLVETAVVRALATVPLETLLPLSPVSAQAAMSSSALKPTSSSFRDAGSSTVMSTSNPCCWHKTNISLTESV